LLIAKVIGASGGSVSGLGVMNCLTGNFIFDE